MKYLNKITAAPYQQFFLTGIPQETITLTLRYMPSQQMWTMDLAQGDFIANGIQIVAAPNLIRNFRNIINFGMACLTSDGLDPYYVDDFANQRVGLYLLTSDEILQIEEAYFS